MYFCTMCFQLEATLKFGLDVSIFVSKLQKYDSAFDTKGLNNVAKNVRSRILTCFITLMMIDCLTG